MDSRKIEELLKKYWECETSLEEEKVLREYFEGSNVPNELRETAALFNYFSAHKKKSIDDLDFDASLLRPQQTQKKAKLVHLVQNSMRIAAGIAVLMVAIWIVRTEIRKTDPPVVEDTYSDPKIAFEETKKALMMISKGFNKAEEEAKKINLFNQAQEEIQKKDSNNTNL